MSFEDAIDGFLRRAEQATDGKRTGEDVIREMEEDTQLEKLADAIFKVKEFADAPVPGRGDSVAETAFKGLDKLAFDAATTYPKDQRAEDRKRIIRCKDAELVIFAAEDTLLAQEVQAPMDTLLSPFVNVWKAIKFLIKHRKTIFRILKQIGGRVSKGNFAVLLVLVGIVVAINASITIAAFEETIRRTAALREFLTDFMRERALGQDAGNRRYTRTRMAR